MQHSGGTAPLQREIEAAKALREQLSALAGDDEDFLRDAVEGETSIREIIASLVYHEAEDSATISGIEKLISDLQARKKRIEGRIEFRRVMMANGLSIAGLSRLETPGGTVSVKAVARKVLVVLDESAIPSSYWTAGEPKLNRKALLDAVKDREDRIAQAMKLDGMDAVKALAEVPPEILVAALSNGGETIQIRR